MKSSSVASPLLSPQLSAALITNTIPTQELDNSANAGWQCVFVLALENRVRVSADAPFARAVVSECQRPVGGGGQRAGTARAAAAARAARPLTRWSTSESARGGGRPWLHSSKQQALC